MKLCFRKSSTIEWVPNSAWKEATSTNGAALAEAVPGSFGVAVMNLQHLQPVQILHWIT